MWSLFVSIFYKYLDLFTYKMLTVTSLLTLCSWFSLAVFIYLGQNDIGCAATKFIRAGAAGRYSAVAICGLRLSSLLNHQYDWSSSLPPSQLFTYTFRCGFIPCFEMLLIILRVTVVAGWCGPDTINWRMFNNYDSRAALSPHSITLMTSMFTLRLP